MAQGDVQGAILAHSTGAHRRCYRGSKQLHRASGLGPAHASLPGCGTAESQTRRTPQLAELYAVYRRDLRMRLESEQRVGVIWMPTACIKR